MSVNSDSLNKELNGYRTGAFDSVKYFSIKRNARDIVAGFMYLRNTDFSLYKKGDTLTISGFLEGTSYNLKIIYDGKQKVKSTVGYIICHRIIPIVPKNKLFDGENSITVWFTDDENRIPIKIQARMFIGSVGIELTSFRGLRNQLKIVN